MPTRRSIVPAALLATSLVASTFAVAVSPVPPAGYAASHREAPMIANDPLADITDVFMFRSYEAGKSDKVVLAMDVVPGGEPSSGPNYFTFGDDVLYTFHVDNDGDGKAEDIQFEFEFKTEKVRGIIDQLDLFLAYVALPPITKLDGPGSEGLGVRQRYSVTMVKDRRRTKLAEGLIAVPSNVGPRTTPNYDDLTKQGLYSLDGGIRVFAGQRDDPFYIDLGAVFDTLNLRSPGTDMLSGFNVQTIALEVPASLLTVDGQGPDQTAQPNLGMYGSTSRRQVTVLRGNGDADGNGKWVQVQRLANPLVNEAIIGTEDKDRWNALEPEQERRFLDYYRNPRLATALQVVFGASVPATPRDDLVNVLLKYAGQASNTPLSELLRLDLSVPPTPLGAQNRLTVLAGDPAGWPNGRRPIDDVTDIAVRVVGGANYATAGDNVNVNDRPLPDTFPFLSTPWDGRNRVHQNP
ncbi:MAG: DUF4331 domain-containing protein [Chloroflexota bacterium]